MLRTTWTRNVNQHFIAGNESRSSTVFPAASVVLLTAPLLILGIYLLLSRQPG